MRRRMRSMPATPTRLGLRPSPPSPQGGGSSMPLREPPGHRLDQPLAQALVLDDLDRLAEERLQQQRLGLGARQAAGHEIEQEVVVELSAGRAMGALDVVGEDLELGLVV